MLQGSPNSVDKLIRSFGRIKSRKLSNPKKDLLDNFLQHHLLNNDLKGFQNQKKQENILEIGFGFGDFLCNFAQKNPQKNFFGFEPHINGVVNLLNLIKENNIKNIKISTSDIRQQIDIFPNNFFDEVYLLFPDPWPKNKHFKRRLITNKFLDEIISPKVKDSAKITIATDHDDYKTWILANILNCQNFVWTAQSKADWQNFPKDWIFTKYQKKALNEKRSAVLFELLKK